MTRIERIYCGLANANGNPRKPFNPCLLASSVPIKAPLWGWQAGVIDVPFSSSGCPILLLTHHHFKRARPFFTGDFHQVDTQCGAQLPHPTLSCGGVDPVCRLVEAVYPQALAMEGVANVQHAIQRVGKTEGSASVSPTGVNGAVDEVGNRRCSPAQCGC